MYEIKGSFVIARQFSSGAMFAATLEFQQGALSLSTVQPANDGHGEHRVSREAGDGADRDRE